LPEGVGGDGMREGWRHGKEGRLRLEAVLVSYEAKLKLLSVRKGKAENDGLGG